MPPVSRPGDRVAMEAALGPDAVRTLHAQCKAAGIPVDRWHRSAGFASPWELHAVSILADELQAATGRGRKTAEEDAAVRLDLNPDTIRSRSRRWTVDAYRRAA